MTSHRLPRDQEWTALALCAQTDPEAFFPEKGGSTRAAKAVCGRCPVRRECLDYALAFEAGETEANRSYPAGIFGGLSERERRALRAERKTLAATGTDGPAYDATDQAVEQTEQPAPRSYGLAYIGGAHAHRPIPLATDIGVRPTHTPKAPRPTGLDWSKHTAPEPEKPATQAVEQVLRCRWCRQPADTLVDDVCDGCRADAEQQFHAPDNTQLGRELAELERTDPKVAAAAASYDAMVERITRPEDHIQAPAESDIPANNIPAEVTPAPALDVVEHCAQLLRDTARSTDPLVQILRGSALSVLAALDHAHHPTETPVAVPSSTRETATGPTTKPAPKAARPTQTKPQRRRRRTSSGFPIAEAQRLYLEEQQTCAQIAATLGSTVATVRKQLKAAGTPMRDDRARGSGGWNKKTADDDNPGLVDAVRRHYLDEQLTIERTAAAVGLSPKGLIGLMNRHGIERRPPANVAGQAPHWHKLDEQAVTDICDRYKAGDSTVMLAEAYAVSTPTITNALRRSGVQLRTPAQARRLALTRKENQPA